MLFNLPNRIELWRQQGLIDEGTAARLLAFEESGNSRSWVVFGIAGIGITALIAGVVSTLAANWAQISPAMKLFGYFILQIGTGLLFVRNEPKQGIVRETILTVFALLFWAGIALFAQLYNLVGESWESALLWSALALPAVLYAESKMLCSLWCVTLLGGVALWAFGNPLIGPFLHKEHEIFFRTCSALSVPVVLTSLVILGHNFGIVRPQLFAAGSFWGIGSLLFILTPIANIAWIHSTGLPVGASPTHLLIPWVAVACAAVASFTRGRVPIATRTATSFLFVSLAVYATVPALFPTAITFPGVYGQIMGATGFIIVWIIAAVAAALGSLKRFYDIATVAIAIRFIVIYFEAFGSLSQTGIGLIISGVLIIVVAIYWNRLRVRFLRALERGN